MGASLSTSQEEEIQGYIPSYTPSLMHDDDVSIVKVLMSAVGCGKTVAILHELFFRACEQYPNADGVRQTRWVVVRASYSQLKTTTIPTFIAWFGHIAKIVYDSPIRATIKVPLPDGTFLDTTFLFMSLDGDDSLDQLLSLEVTGGGVNELNEVRSTKILKYMQQRSARYPDKKSGVGIKWHGIVADMNPPDINSHWYNVFKKDKPHGYSLYEYPPPIFIERDAHDPDNLDKMRFVPNPLAENANNQQLGYDYWIELAKSNITDWDFITKFVLGDFPFGGDGRPVYPNFSHAKHVDPTVSKTVGSLLLIGMDFGFQPAAAFCQYADGRLNLIDEIVTEDASLTEFCEELLLPKLQTEYYGLIPLIIGDPSGETGTSTIDRATSYRKLKEYNLKVVRPPTNLFKQRREDVIDVFARRDGFAVHPRCTTFVGGAASGYCWKENKGTTKKQPDKNNIYSHVHDAFQYVAGYLRSGGEVYTQLGQSHDSFATAMNVGGVTQRKQAFLYT